MNKHFTTYIFLISLLLFPLLQASAEPQFFRSNSLGLPLEEISRTRTDDFSYILERHTEKEGIEELLFLDGELLRRSLYHYRGELLSGLHYEGDDLLRESLEEKGKLIEEKLFDGERSIIRSYSWEGDLLEYTVTREQGTQAFRDRYIRGQNGRLLQVIREDLTEDGEDEAGENPRTVGDFNYERDGRGSTRWHRDMEGCSHFFYDDEDRKIHEKYCGGILTYQYREEHENGTIKVAELFPGEDREVEELLDVKRRPLLRIERLDGQELREEYLYEEELLKELIVDDGRNVRKTVYTYSSGPSQEGDGKKLRSEEVYQNGLLVKEIFYLDGGRHRELLYREGRPVVELLYEGEELLQRNETPGSGWEG